MEFVFFSENSVLLARELIFSCFVMLFSFFAFHGDTSKTAVLLACEFNSGNSIDMFCVFVGDLGNAQNRVSTCLSSSRLFLISGAFLQALEPYGRPKASLWASIRSIR